MRTIYFPGAEVQLVRKMRGATQAHLLRVPDGSCWVVKFNNNPLGARVLVNDLVSSLLLGKLGVATPEPAVIRIDGGFLENGPGVLLTSEAALCRLTPGCHFGSRFPGDPTTTAVFDFLPDVMLPLVANYDDFLGVLLFDLWTCNVGCRQAIFFREQYDDGTATGRPAVRWIAQMIDHVGVFGGARWRLSQTEPRPLHWYRPTLLAPKPSIRTFARWIARIQALPDRVFNGILERVPAEWIRGEERELQELFAELLARRNRVPALLAEALRSRPGHRWAAPGACRLAAAWGHTVPNR